MKPTILLLTLLVAAPLAAQSAADSAAIVATAHDYIDGCYEGNPERRAGDLGLSTMGMNQGLRFTLERGRQYYQAWEDDDAGTGPRPQRCVRRPSEARQLSPMKVPLECSYQMQEIGRARTILRVVVARLWHLGK